jgi:alpha-glucosidase
MAIQDGTPAVGRRGRAADAPWWKTGVVYQVYPRSFQDGNGDGVGDLAGAERRLDHLVELGVDAVWLSPIFPSPMADFGYDVSDYCDIDPRFGTLADFDRLLAAAHARGLKVLLDFVPNHTSEQHPWFVESRSSRTSPRRDWYIWRDPAPDGGPPNNWLSDFGGSAWEWDAATGQYYLHGYLKEQPDLNWRNPAVREAMLQVLRFWFERGVDGFRIDVLWRLIKAEGFPDDPPNPDFRPGMAGMERLLQLNSTDQPETIEIAAQMRRVAESYPGDRLLVGEIYLPIGRLVAYYGLPERPAVHLPFNFQLIEAPWRAEVLHRIIGDYEAALPPGAWPNWVLGNHDRPRIAQRVGPEQARVAAVLLLTLRGTPTVYYGDELGLPDTPIPPDRVQDPRELNEPGLGLGRDPVRSPMPWDGGPQAGFTTGEPWLPLNPDWPRRNVETQRGDPGSMLNLHRRLLALRRARPCLALGDILLHPVAGAVLTYERRLAGARLIVALNLGPDPADVVLPRGVGEAILSTHAALPTVCDGRTRLQANEAAVFEAAPAD